MFLNFQVVIDCLQLQKTLKNCGFAVRLYLLDHLQPFLINCNPKYGRSKGNHCDFFSILRLLAAVKKTKKNCGFAVRLEVRLCLLDQLQSLHINCNSKYGRGKMIFCDFLAFWCVIDRQQQ